MIKITGTEEELDKMRNLLSGPPDCFWGLEDCVQITCEECIKNNFIWEVVEE